MQKKLASVFAVAALLVACGGGGGNAGACLGSEEVCLEGDNPNVATGQTTANNSATTVPNTSTPGTNTTTTTTTTPTTPVAPTTGNTSTSSN